MKKLSSSLNPILITYVLIVSYVLYRIYLFDLKSDSTSAVSFLLVLFLSLSLFYAVKIILFQKILFINDKLTFFSVIKNKTTSIKLDNIRSIEFFSQRAPRSGNISNYLELKTYNKYFMLFFLSGRASLKFFKHIELTQKNNWGLSHNDDYEFGVYNNSFAENSEIIETSENLSIKLIIYDSINLMISLLLATKIG